MNLLTWLGGWWDRRMDMHLDFTGDLMTPDWSEGDGDPVLRPEHKPVTRNIGAYYTRQNRWQPRLKAAHFLRRLRSMWND